MEDDTTNVKEKYIVNLGRTGLIEKEKIKPIKNIHFIKPIGGLWCCRENTPEGYSWTDWCQDNEPEWLSEQNAVITIKNSTKIYIVKDEQSFLNLEFIGDIKADLNDGFLNRILSRTLIDYEKMAKKYDIIDFRISEFYELYELLYGLDCDSCLILNPDCIEEIKNPVQEKIEENQELDEILANFKECTDTENTLINVRTDSEIEF